MPLPIAHGLMGATVIALCQRNAEARKNWRAYALGFILAVAPDADILFKWFPFSPFAGRGWHHDFTHSLGFALLCGWLVAVLFHESREHTRQMFVYAGAMATHPLMDWLFTTSSGVELLWPFRHDRMRLGFESPILYAWRGPSLPGKVLALMQFALAELLIYGSLFLLAWWLSQNVLGKPARQKA